MATYNCIPAKSLTAGDIVGLEDGTHTVVLRVVQAPVPMLVELPNEPAWEWLVDGFIVTLGNGQHLKCMDGQPFCKLKV